MPDELELLREDEALVVPLPGDGNLAFVAGADPGIFGQVAPPTQSLASKFLEAAGYAGGASGARRLSDGSLVQLSPETLAHLRASGEFVRDGRGYAIGVMKTAGKPGFSKQVRFMPGAANPVAAAMLLQTMALQGQLKGIQEALERIEAKIAVLAKGTQIEVLAKILAITENIQQMRRKVEHGVSLSAEDENQLRSLETQVSTLRNQARLWLQHLAPLMTGERVSLRRQHDALQTALKKEHVGFWVRAALASDVMLAELLVLKTHRAAVAEAPEWASQVIEDAQNKRQEIGQALLDLHAGLDLYMRRSDIARGFEELSISRKREVRTLRRQLLTVTNQLRDGLELSAPLLEASMGRPLPALPKPLDRRAVEPHVVRDNVADAAKQTGRSAGRGIKSGGKALGRGSRSAVSRALEARSRGSSTDRNDRDEGK